MRKRLPRELEQGRLRRGYYASEPGDLHGAFCIAGEWTSQLRILSSGVDREFGWEHVSVSTDRRCPSWEEMQKVKELFWMDDEVVMQLHPAKKDHISVAHYCLHLWRPLEAVIPLPPTELIA
jgi:hypothetical protein